MIRLCEFINADLKKITDKFKGRCFRSMSKASVLSMSLDVGGLLLFQGMVSDSFETPLLYLFLFSCILLPQCVPWHEKNAVIRHFHLS